MRPASPLFNSSMSRSTPSKKGISGLGVAKRSPIHSPSHGNISPVRSLSPPTLASSPPPLYHRRKRSSPEPSSRNLQRRLWTYQLVWTLLWAFLIVAFFVCEWGKTKHHPPPSRVPGVDPRLRGAAVTTTTASLFSNETFSSTITEEREPVVHVIQTRFMQQQPHLVELGLARLEIFKTFCLPTIIHQTSQDFVWIIRTDPELNATLREPLLELLLPYNNFVLIGSNDNPEGFRSIGLSDVTPANVWTDNYAVLERQYQQAQSRIVLESRLDADDGLHVLFVDYVQQQTATLLQEANSWMIWCAYSHLEWHSSSPFSKQEESSRGYFVGLKHSGCVTPGLTAAYAVGAGRHLLPALNHRFLHVTVPSCSKTQLHNCLKRFQELTPGAVRARTPTSAGMNNVIIGKFGQRSFYKPAEKQGDMQDKIWAGVHKVFTVESDAAIKTKEYLTQHLQLIAADNLVGQCTKGHSCKNSAKDLLKKLQSWTSGLPWSSTTRSRP